MPQGRSSDFILLLGRRAAPVPLDNLAINSTSSLKLGDGLDTGPDHRGTTRVATVRDEFVKFVEQLRIQSDCDLFR